MTRMFHYYYNRLASPGCDIVWAVWLGLNKHILSLNVIPSELLVRRLCAHTALHRPWLTTFPPKVVSADASVSTVAVYTDISVSYRKAVLLQQVYSRTLGGRTVPGRPAFITRSSDHSASLYSPPVTHVGFLSVFLFVWSTHTIWKRSGCGADDGVKGHFAIRSQTKAADCA